MKLELPDTIASSQDLSEVIMEIKSYLTWLTHESVKKQAGSTTTSAMPTISSTAQSLIQAHGTDKASLEALATNLEAAQKRAKVITITLAALPSGSVKSSLVGWCRREIAPDILVNFSFNRAILGGMVVRAGSRVFDWSFRRSILAASDNFPEVLRRV